MVKRIIKQYVKVMQWHTKRKIVVIESDDWGSIRMPDLTTSRILSKLNPHRIADTISEIDSLETNDDLSYLFDVLSGVTDKNGNPAVITANTIVANPDFDKIEASNYQQYFYENFTETLKRYPQREKVTNLISEGINAGVYKPQFHGREHLNVYQWLTALQNGHIELLEAFKHRVFGIALNDKISKRKNVMASLDLQNKYELQDQKKIIEEGVEIFHQIFGFYSKSFIANSYIWSEAIEPTLKRCGIDYLQGIPFQYLPNPDGAKYKRKFHFTGQRNKNDQVYLVRNAFFEPTLIRGEDTTGICLKRISQAFNAGTPVIIGAHRVNFIGSIDEANRTSNLKLLTALLKRIVLEWPDVEFMSSDSLGDLIVKK